MTTTTTRPPSYPAHREDFLARLAVECTSPGCPLWLAMKEGRLILRNTRTLHMLAERDCNQGLSESERRRQGALEDRVRMSCATLGLPSPMFNHDPRGAVVRLVLKSGYSDSFAGSGFCVPTP